MTDPIRFPDAVAVVVDYLTTELAARGDDATVTSKVPDPRPDRLVRVSRTGGPRTSLVSDGAQISVECWDLLEEDAQDLAQTCRALLLVMRGTVQSGVAVYRVSELGGPALLPDPLSNAPRYVFSQQVQMRGELLETAS